MTRIIRINREILAEVLRHASLEAAQECCGLLAGSNGLIARIFPAVNVAANPATNYEIAPQEVCAFMRQMRSEKIEFLGIYHSHPNGKNEPSPRDIERAYSPKWLISLSRRKRIRLCAFFPSKMDLQKN